MQGPSRRQHWGGLQTRHNLEVRGMGLLGKRVSSCRYNYTSDEQCVSLRTAGGLEVSGLGPFGPEREWS